MGVFYVEIRDKLQVDNSPGKFVLIFLVCEGINAKISELR
jgi:hypothetical protein